MNLRFSMANATIAAAIVIIIIGAVLAAPLGADQCVTLENFSSSTPNTFPSGWKPREQAGRNVYTVMKEGDTPFVRARAAGPKASGNGSEADRPVTWNLQEYPILRWQWRPRAFPRGANENLGKDDSALGLYIGFCPPEEIGLCERMLKSQLSLSDHFSMPKLLLAKGVGSLKYIWSEKLPRGFEFQKRQKAVKVLQSGLPAQRDLWVEERIDVASDYQRRFRVEKLLNPIGISILTDSDDTQTDGEQSIAEGDYADFKVCRQ